MLKKLKIVFIHIYFRCFKIPKANSSNTSNISDYVNIVEIISTQHYTGLSENRFPKQKMLGNDRMETAIQQLLKTTLINPGGELIDIS